MAKNPWPAWLRAQPREVWPAFLTESSGPPGPRANLPLVGAVAITADIDMAATLLEDGGEYTAMCAAAVLAYHADAPEVETRALMLATDQRWRVREGVALGLQLLGEEKPDVLMRIVQQWVEDPHPLIQRAAIVAICEPRLLRDLTTALAALDACQRATAIYAALPTSRRREHDARSLRQALGYCWSVAVAAHPRAGIEAFSALDATDNDIVWIKKQNRRKKRLAALL